MRHQFWRLTLRVGLLLGATVLLAGPLRSQEQAGRSKWTWNSSDDGRRIEVTVENRVDFSEDYAEVTAIPFDGALRIYDSRGARTLRLAITRGPAGDLRRDYSINGQSSSFETSGRDWLRAVLLQAAREGGLDANKRAAGILKQRGPRGLLDEIAYLRGDYVRQIYFAALLTARGVSSPDLRSALRNAANTIKSDYEKAQLFVKAANVFLVSRDLLTDYFEAVAKIRTPYEHARVLSAALKRNDLSKQALSAIAQSAASIDSDFEKANLLINGAERYQGSLSLRTDWLHAVRSIGSDYEHHRVLSGALKPDALSTDALSDLVQSAARIQSDSEKASFLIEAMSHYRADAHLRAVFLETARTIGSEYERGRVQQRFEKVDF